MAAWLGPAISAVGGVLGSLFGGGKKETTSTVNYRKMVRDAEAAGFNPLTAIRNGGSAGFTTTSHPGLSSGEFIAQAFGHAGAAISAYDPIAKQTAQLEEDIKRATLANIQADTAYRQRASIGGVPVSTGSTVEKPKNLYEAWVDNSAHGGGKIIMMPSADLPDLDQMLVPTVGHVGNDVSGVLPNLGGSAPATKGVGGNESLGPIWPDFGGMYQTYRDWTKPWRYPEQ